MRIPSWRDVLHASTMGLAVFGKRSEAKDRVSESLAPLAFEHKSTLSLYRGLKQPGPHLSNARPCRGALTSPAADPVFPKGTSHELFDYLSAGKNVSIRELQAGRVRYNLGSISLESHDGAMTLSVYGDTQAYAVDNCTGLNAQTARMIFTGPAARETSMLLQSLPLGAPWWVSSQTAHRRLRCEDDACTLQTWNWPDHCFDSITKPCLPDTPLNPDTYVMSEALEVFTSAGYGVVNFASEHHDGATLPLHTSDTENPGCYVGCYTHSGLGAYESARGIWIAGQSRVRGSYDRGICQPENVTEATLSCEVFEACNFSSCWLGGDTGGWYNLP